MSTPPSPVPLAGWVDPADVFAALFASETHAFFLDAGPDASSGWSWVGAGARESDVARVRAVDLAPTGGVAPHSALESGPFQGGWVGWIPYESGAAEAGAAGAVADPHDLPESWVRTDDLVAFDHGARRAWVVRARRGTAELAARVASVPRRARPDARRAPRDVPRPARARHRPDEYALLIERCRDRIREGDAYQLCLTTRFSVDGPVDAREAHERLRAGSASHHGGMLRAGDSALVSASPERFLEVRGSGLVRTHPIKGTRSRDRDLARDRALAEELRADPKERAENVMIVDLMRNDLSRVCLPGTVSVDRLLEVESYPAVHQLVSTVSGTLRPATALGDLLAAAFPAGSMTGAPKLSAMTILHALEEAPRGLFAGCFGWVGADGTTDLAMVIRSIVVHPGGAYVGAGGGITWRSRAASEVAEVGIKAAAPLAAMGATLPPGW